MGGPLPLSGSTLLWHSPLAEIGVGPRREGKAKGCGSEEANERERGIHLRATSGAGSMRGEEREYG